MAYPVELTHRAERDLSYLFERISASDSAAAASWFNGLEEAIYTLERFPRRCPMAPEASATAVMVRRPWHRTHPSTSHWNVWKLRAWKHGAQDASSAATVGGRLTSDMAPSLGLDISRVSGEPCSGQPARSVSPSHRHFGGSRA